MQKDLILSEEFYENIGKLRTYNSLSKMDHIRFKYVSKFLIGESIFRHWSL